MSNSQYGSIPAGHIGIGAQFVTADGTIGKVVMDAVAALAASSISPLMYGGASVYDLMAHSSDTSARDVQFYRGNVLTTAGVATGAMSTTTSTIVRASGSFVTDGWRVGKQAMIFAAMNDAPQAVEGILCVVTGVSALTLTVSGTPLSALSLTAGCRVASVEPMYAATVPAGSGNSGAVVEAWVLSSTNVNATRVKDEKFSAVQMLIASMKTAVTASTVVTMSGSAAKY